VCDSTLYQSFKVQSSDGYLQFIGNTPVSFLFNTPLSFSRNNLYAYGSIENAYWDNANHLYALSQNRHSLYVFTVTTTSARQAPGSPYNIPGTQNIIVQPR
jgi:hypothetical protein